MYRRHANLIFGFYVSTLLKQELHKGRVVVEGSPHQYGNTILSRI